MQTIWSMIFPFLERSYKTSKSKLNPSYKHDVNPKKGLKHVETVWYFMIFNNMLKGSKNDKPAGKELPLPI